MLALHSQSITHTKKKKNLGVIARKVQQEGQKNGGFQSLVLCKEVSFYMRQELSPLGPANIFFQEAEGQPESGSLGEDFCV